MRLLFACASLIALLLGAPEGRRYAQVTVDYDGRLRILREDGRRITPNLDGDQQSASRPAISPDGRSVAWLAEYPNCCTSYPLPLKIVLLHDGRRHVLEGPTALWFWMFQEGGTMVAAKGELPHGGLLLNYARWDVTTGRKISAYRPKYDPYGYTVARPREPAWVRELDTAEERYGQRSAQAAEHLFEFVGTADRVPMMAELRDNGEAGIDSWIRYQDVSTVVARGVFFSRETALQWAQQQRRAIERP